MSSPLHSCLPENPELQFAESFDGHPIAYRVWGEGEPTVLLQNGIACHQVFLQKLIERLSRRCRVVHWHYRGHGDTPPPRKPDDWTLAVNVSDMLAVQNAVHAPLAVVGGFSMGVQLNLEYYRRHPDRVAGIINLAGSYEKPLHTLYYLGPIWELGFPTLRRLVRTIPRTAHLFWSVLLGGPWAYRTAGIVIYDGKRMPREDFRKYQEHFIGIDLDLFLFGLLQLNAHSAADLLPSVRVPMLIVAGTRDNFTPIRVNRRMHELAPGSELFEVEGGTHATLLEYPDEVNERVDRFVAEHFPQ